MDRNGKRAAAASASRTRRHSAPAQPGLIPGDMTISFRQALSNRRMNDFTAISHARLAPPAMQDSVIPRPPSLRPARARLQNLPHFPHPPEDRRSVRFRSQLHMLSNYPLQWENPALLDQALAVIPLEKIYSEAEEESQYVEAVARSQGKRAIWAYHDCVIKALMKWFKHSFFEWVNNPPCDRCNTPTIAKGLVAPLPEERERSASKVELYQCISTTCQSYVRFPRYQDPFVLLQTRRGRVGEWNGCFGMFCRAVGSRVRWVWQSEDYVVLEVFSEHRKRWVHVDVVENYFDQPQTYTKSKLMVSIVLNAGGANIR